MHKTDAIINSFELLFKNNYVKLCLYAKQFLKEEELAEDVVQEVFTNLWKLNNIERVENIPEIGLIYKSVKNACLNKLRRKKLEDNFLNHQDNNPFEDIETLNQIIRAEVITEIHQIIATLPPNCQVIFKMGYLDGLKNPQIAEELGISVNTVKTQKQRGLKMIVSRLSNEHFSLLFTL